MSSSRFRRMHSHFPSSRRRASAARPISASETYLCTARLSDDAWGMVKLTPDQQSMLVDAAGFRPAPAAGARAIPMCSGKADATTLEACAPWRGSYVCADMPISQMRGQTSRISRSHNPGPVQRSLSHLRVHRSIAPRSCRRRSRATRGRTIAQACEFDRCASCDAGQRSARVDRGQFGHVPPDIRAWFKSVIAPNGVPSPR